MPFRDGVKGCSPPKGIWVVRPSVTTCLSSTPRTCTVLQSPEGDLGRATTL